MTWRDFQECIAKDLGVKPRRARAYTEAFRGIYKGHKEAITDVSASYSKTGKVKIEYIINGTKNHLLV